MAYYIMTVGIKTEYIGKAAERLRRKTKGPVKWQPAAFLFKSICRWAILFFYLHANLSRQTGKEKYDAPKHWHSFTE